MKQMVKNSIKECGITDNDINDYAVDKIAEISKHLMTIIKDEMTEQEVIETTTFSFIAHGGQESVSSIYSKIEAGRGNKTIAKVFEDFIWAFKQVLELKKELKYRDYIKLFIEYLFSLVVKNKELGEV